MARRNKQRVQRLPSNKGDGLGERYERGPGEGSSNLEWIENNEWELKKRLLQRNRQTRGSLCWYDAYSNKGENCTMAKK